jgi:AraC-like DNA-binding protein
MSGAPAPTTALATTHVAFLGTAAMHYEELAPPAWLSPWVAVMWRMRAREATVLPVLPDGCMDVIGDDVVGSLTAPLYAPFAAGETACGIRFHPGGLPRLLGVPADELVNQQLPLRDVVADNVSLRRLAADAERPDPLARAVYAARDLREVCRTSGYSERQVRRRVLAATGHSPKRLMRIGRMQRLLLSGRGESWARSAVDHGFYDEAHMANDVRALAGATPHALLGG